MNIQKISFSANQPSFKQQQKQYENPVSRSTERNLAVLGSVGCSGLIGAIAGGLATCFVKSGRKIPIGIGVGVGLLSLLFTLPQNLYNTKVNAFARQKEMDVFSRQKAAQAGIYGDINAEIKDEDVPLDKKIGHYATVRMADNGNGVMIKGV